MAEPEVLLSEIGAFVPFPSALLDAQMPKLKDTEWRLLCVIVRQTLGWQRGKGRKKRDWMTQKQLIARTGRNSAALSAALDALVRKNLVECHDSDGELLLSKQQRRQHRGRIYFSLSSSSRTAVAPKPRQRKPTKGNPPEAILGNNAFRGRVNIGWTKARDVAEMRNYAPNAGDSM